MMKIITKQTQERGVQHDKKSNKKSIGTSNYWSFQQCKEL